MNSVMGDSRALAYQYAWTLSNILQLGPCAATKYVNSSGGSTYVNALRWRSLWTSGSLPKQTTSTRATDQITLCLIASYAS
jgi:hypothetical protein